MKIRRSPTHPSTILWGRVREGDARRALGGVKPRGLAPPPDFGELSRAAAVPVPLLLRRGQAPKRRAPVPNSMSKG